MKMDAELVFIPSPGVGHLFSTVEFAKLLVRRDDRLYITVLVMKLPSDDQQSSAATAADPTKSLSSAEERIRLVYLPNHQDDDGIPKPPTNSPRKFFTEFIARHQKNVRDHIVSNMMSENGRPRLVGFVVDMFCTPMIDVADELGVPSYVFFTSNSALLGLMFYLYNHNQLDVADLFKDSPTGKYLSVPAFAQPIPAEVLPSVVLDKEGGGNTMFLNITKRFRDCKGILVNTFTELEPHALNSFLNDDKIPPVYPVGPVLKLDLSVRDAGGDTIMSWLDIQPPSSVVFLCFGSMGSFSSEQVIEIAKALESSGHRFLWSLRRPPPPPSEKGKPPAFQLPGEYEDPSEILPEGFLGRTAEVGKVIGWAPQVAVLSHPAVGGFVSHCGWNSTLESLWFGVPMATWPLYAEQQMNAFELVKELGLAVEIKLDYRKDDSNQSIVTAAEIESGIRKLMDCDESTEIRQKIKEMSQKSRINTTEGGSSYNSLGRFIEDVICATE